MEPTLLLQRKTFNIQGPQPYVRPPPSLIEEEHVYMNSETLLEILRKNNNFSSDRFFNVKEESDDKSQEENFYENTDFLKSLEVTEGSQKTDYLGTMKENKETFVSTLSIAVGSESSQSPDLDSLRSVSTHSQQDQNEDMSIFKSSYAKKLADSFKRKGAQTQTSLPCMPFESVSPLEISPDTHPLRKSTTGISAHSTPRISPTLIGTKSPPKLFDISDNSTQQLEMELARKEEEISIANKNLLNMKLEICRLKAENRSLKEVHDASNQPVFTPTTTSLNDTENLDVWSMKKLIVSLKNKLEKAEMQKRAFESASRQLAEFLQTISTHLITVSGKDQNNEISIVETNEMLMNFHNTFTSPVSPPEEHLHGRRPTTEQSLTLDPLKGRYKKGDKAPYLKKQKGGSLLELTANTNKKSKQRNNRRKSDIGPLLPNIESALKTSSVLDLRSPNDTGHKVNRAASTQCISDFQPTESKTAKLRSSLIASRNKGFFRSLKNIFKIETPDKNLDPCQNSRKKHPSFFSKKVKTPEPPSHLDDNDVSAQSSIFYVSYDKSDPVDDGIKVNTQTEASHDEKDEFVLPDLGPSLLETIDQHQSENCVDSGPEEISVALPDNADSGYVTDKTQPADKEYEAPVEASRAMSTV